MLSKAFVVRFVSDILSPLFFLPAIALIPLSTASSILQAIPILVTMGAALVLGQKVGWRRWSAISIGFFGVLLIVRPGMAGFDPASILAILGAVFLASRDLATRVMPSGLSTIILTTYAFGASIIAGIFLIPFFEPLLWPTPTQWFWLLILTLLGGLFAVRMGLVKAMFVSGIFMASTNILFSILAWVGNSETLFAFTVLIDDLSAAFATVAFVGFISALVDRTYTATQYALLASIGTAGRTLFASSSGMMVDWLNGNWVVFFVITALMVIPSLICLFLIRKKLNLNE